MRFVSFLMIVAGAAIAFGLPVYGQYFTDFEITTQPAYSAAQGGSSFRLDLAPGDSPVRFELTVESGQGGPGGRMDFPVVVNGSGGTIFSHVTTIMDGEIGETQVLPVFDVPAEDAYAVTFGPLVDEGLAPDAMTVRIIGNAISVPTGLDTLGYVLIGVGTAGFMFSGLGSKRRRQARRSQDAAADTQPQRGPWAQGGTTSQIGRAPPEPSRRAPEPEKPKHTWGRGDDQ